MEDAISPRERAEIAAAVDVDEQYLYQCLVGRKDMKPKEAVRVERQSGGRLRRWHLRQSDWHQTWPELIGTEGAPAVPAADGVVRDAA
jgi:DNA-binding transcriptional regulator YdaS (Cro superfamily)